MKRIKLTLALAALMLGGAVAAQTTADVTAKYNEAAQLLSEKKFQEAAAAFEDVVKLGEAVGADAEETVENAKKVLPTVCYNAGMLSAKNGQYDQAIALLDKAAQYGDPMMQTKATKMSANVYMVMGNEEFNNKAYEKAIALYEKGYAEDPNNTKLALNLARSQAELGQLDKAAGTYQALIDLGKTHSKYQADAATAKTELANYLLVAAVEAAKANNVADVNKYVDMVIASDSTNATAQLLRVQTANNAKQYDLVIEYGDVAAETQTDPALKSDAYFLLGSAYENKGNKAKAIEAYKKVTAGKNVAAAQAQAKALAQ